MPPAANWRVPRSSFVVSRDPVAHIKPPVMVTWARAGRLVATLLGEMPNTTRPLLWIVPLDMTIEVVAETLFPPCPKTISLPVLLPVTSIRPPDMLKFTLALVDLLVWKGCDGLWGSNAWRWRAW